MDNNKLSTLHSIGYKILECCGTCENSNFDSGREFGTCSKYTYSHLKHQNQRQLSIHIFGSCFDGYKYKEPTGELKIFKKYL